MSPGRLLDVGCAKGHFLRVARDEFSWDVVGLDVSEWAAKYARSVYGIEVQITSVTEACFSKGEFDVIHSNHVWEHLPAPLTALQKANEWLKPGGYFYLEVPNEIDSLPWHLDKFLGRTRIEGSVFGRREPRTSPTPHLSFFTLKTLTHMIERSGLKVVASRTRTDITQPGTWFRKNFSMATKLKVMFYHLTRLTGQFIGRGSNIIAIARKPISTSSARQ